MEWIRNRIFGGEVEKEYQYTPDKAGMDELLAKGQTEKKLLLLVTENIRGKCLQILLLPILRDTTSVERVYHEIRARL